MSSTLLSRLLGFARNALVSFYFGAGGRADVLNIVLALPNNLRRLLAEGALGLALVPELARLLRDGERGRAQKLVSTLLSAQALLLLPSVFLLVFTPELLAGWFFRFPDAEKIQQAAKLLPLVAPFLLLVSASAIFAAVFDAHSRFTLTALTPLGSSIMVILFTVLAQQRLGVAAVLWGLAAGTFLQAILFLIGLHRLRFVIALAWQWRDEAMKRVLRLWLPVWLCSIIVAINQQIAYFLASRLVDGSASILSYSLLFFQLPYGIFYASIARVSLPRVSRALGATDDKAQERLLQTLRFAFHNLLVLLLPASLLLFFLRYELVSLAFQRGMFTAADSQRTADMLAFYSLGLLATGCYDFSQRSFFAAGAPQIPFRLGLLVMFLDVSLSLLLMPILGVYALAMANTLAFTIGALLMITFLSRKLGNFADRTTKSLILRVGCCGLVLWAVNFILNMFLSAEAWQSGASWSNFLRFALRTSALLSVLLIMLMLLRIPVLKWQLRWPKKSDKGRRESKAKGPADS